MTFLEDSLNNVRNILNKYSNTQAPTSFIPLQPANSDSIIKPMNPSFIQQYNDVLLQRQQQEEEEKKRKEEEERKKRLYGGTDYYPGNPYNRQGLTLPNPIVPVEKEQYYNDKPSQIELERLTENRALKYVTEGYPVTTGDGKVQKIKLDPNRATDIAFEEVWKETHQDNGISDPSLYYKMSKPRMQKRGEEIRSRNKFQENVMDLMQMMRTLDEAEEFEKHAEKVKEEKGQQYVSDGLTVTDFGSESSQQLLKGVQNRWIISDMLNGVRNEDTTSAMDAVKKERTKDKSYIAPQEEATNYKQLVKDYAISTGQETEEGFDQWWSELTDRQKINCAILAVGRNYFKNNEQQNDYFSELKDPKDRLAALAVQAYGGNQGTVAEEFKNRFQKNQDEMHLKEKSIWGLTFEEMNQASADSFKNASNDWTHAGKLFNNYNYLGWAGYTLNSVGNFIGGAMDKIMQLPHGLASWITDLNKGDDKSESIVETESYMRELVNNSLEKQAQPIKQKLESLPDSEISKLETQLDELSRDASAQYSIEKDEGNDNLTKLSKEETIDLFSKTAVMAKLTGEQAASKYLSDFWTDHMEKRQGFWDCVGRTGGQFLSTAAGDVLSFLGVLLDPFINPNGSLVKDNVILNYANALVETGCWTQEQQEKYRAAGLNNYQLYRNVEEQGQFLTLKDVGDVFGQYGFTAACTLLSFGSSAAVRGLSKLLSNRKVAQFLPFMKNSTRKLLIKGLTEGSSLAEKRRAIEILTQISQKTMYRGNLGISMSLGTAEGGLEATSTYNKAMDDYTGIVNSSFEGKERPINFDDQSFVEHLNNTGELKEYVEKGVKQYLTATKQDYTEDQIQNILNQVEENPYSIMSNPEFVASIKQMYKQDVDRQKQQALEHAQEDAISAGIANFWCNSAINGIIMVTLKDVLLSQDAQTATRIFKNKKAKDVLKNIEITEEKGVVRATAKPTPKKGIRTWIRDQKEIAKGAFRQSFGEYIEESSQSISDQATRAAFQTDLERYIDACLSPEGIMAYCKDSAAMINQALQTINDTMFSQDVIKEGLFGFASSMIGGLSPLGLLWKVPSGIYKLNKQAKKEDKSVSGKDIGKLLLENFWESSIINSARRYNIDKQSNEVRTELLTDRINAWLNDPVHKGVLEHLGGAAGFKNAIMDYLNKGEVGEAQDAKLDSMIQSIFMLDVLKDTIVGKEFLRKINDKLGLDIQEEDNRFDEQGNYIRRNFEEEGERQAFLEEKMQQGMNQDEAQEALNEAIEEQISIVNLIGSSRAHDNYEGKSDKQVLQQVQRNAEQYVEFLDKVRNARNRVLQIFAGDTDTTMDPLAVEALTRELLVTEDAEQKVEEFKRRREQQLAAAREKQDSPLNRVSGLNADDLHVAAYYGSLKNLRAQRAQLNGKRTILREHLKTENNQDKRKGIQEKINELNEQINTLDKVEERYKIKEVEASQGETKEVDPNLDFTAGDIANMSVEQRAQVIRNRESDRYSNAQKKAINQYLDAMRDNATQTTQEVADLAQYEYEYNKKAEIFTKHLQEFLQKPSFITDYIGKQRYINRKKVLKYKYSEDLTLKEGETPIEATERIQAQIKKLEDDGKKQDAYILKSLFAESKPFINLQRVLSEVAIIENANVVSQGAKYNDGQKVDTTSKRFKRALLALRALANLSTSATEKEVQSFYEDLHRQLLNPRVQQNIKDILAGKINEINFLNKELKENEIDPINFESEEGKVVLDSVLQDMRTLINTYLSLRIQQQSQQVQAARDQVALRSKKQTQDNGVKNSNDQQSTGSRREKRSVVVNTAANVTNKKARAFLDKNNHQQTAQKFDGKQTVYYMVTREDGSSEPVIYAVVRDKENGTLLIGGYKYGILGVVGKAQSRMLTAAAEKEWRKLGNRKSRRLLQYGGELKKKTGFIRSNVVKLGQARQSTLNDYEDSSPLNELYQNEVDLNEFVEHFHENSKCVPVETSMGNSVEQVRHDNHRVEFGINSQDQIKNIFDFVIGNKQLSQLYKEWLQSLDANKDQKFIKQLMQNEYFKAYFLAYSQIAELDTQKWEPFNVFEALIEEFVYLGVGHENENVNIDYSTGVMTIKGPKEESMEFQIPTSKDTAEAVAFSNIIKIFDDLQKAIDGKKSVFQYYYAQLNHRYIKNSSSYINGIHKDDPRMVRERMRIKGLIQAGMLVGYKSDGIYRQVVIDNPFADSQPLPTKELGTSVESDPTEVPKGTEPIAQNIHRKVFTEKEQLEQATNNVKEFINWLGSQKVKLPNKNSSTYEDEEENKMARATQMEPAYHGGKAVEFDGDPDSGGIAGMSALGNTGDDITREVLQILDELKGLYKNKEDDAARYILTKLKELETFKNGIPNFSDDQVLMFIKDLIKFKEFCDQKGWVLFPKGVTLSMIAPVLDSNNQVVNSIGVAGTMDLLVWDSTVGEFILIDFKTKRDTAGQGRNNLEKYSINNYQVQLSSYCAMLVNLINKFNEGRSEKDQVPLNINPTAFLLDIAVNCITHQQMNKIGLTVDEDGRTIVMNQPGIKPVLDGEGSLRLNGFKHLELDQSAEKALFIPTKILPFYGYDQESIPTEYSSLLQKEEIADDVAEASPDPIVNNNNGDTVDENIERILRENLASKEGEEETKEKEASDNEEKAPSENVSSNFDVSNKDKFKRKKPLNSERTKRQSLFTDFIQRRIRPVTNVKISKLKYALKSLRNLLRTSRYENKIISKELADTFFSGDEKKLKQILGSTKISKNNLQEIFQKIHDYFDKYTSKRESYEEFIKQRHAAIKLFYKHLTGKMSLGEFRTQFERLGIPAHCVPDINEYLEQGGNRKMRGDYLNRIIASKMYKQEEADDRIREMNDFMDDMQAKQDFLEYNGAYEMFLKRIDSVKDAIKEDNFTFIEDEAAIEDYQTGSLFKVMKGGMPCPSTSVLTYIIHNTQNLEEKRVAEKLLKLIKDNDLDIIIVGNEDEDFIVEGESDIEEGIIRLGSISFTSDETFNRVALHEILHQVIQLKPETRKVINDYLQNVLQYLEDEYGISRGELKDRYYGLTNVDEFVSEFFTNYAFQELIRSVPVLMRDGQENNMFDITASMIAQQIGIASAGNMVDYTMEKLIFGMNNENVRKQDIEEIAVDPTRKSYSQQSQEVKARMKSLGLEAEDYDLLSNEEIKALEECCNA